MPQLLSTDSTELKVQALQAWLINNDLNAVIIPHEDEFLGEYIPAHNERLLWLTGFTGSAGIAVITQNECAIFVDGRYTVQVTKEVPNDIFQYKHLIEDPAVEWTTNVLADGSNIAIDPQMHNGSWLTNARSIIEKSHTLTLLEANPIDLLWSDRPAPTLSDIRLMGIDAVGVSSLDKRQDMAKALVKLGVDSCVITALDSIAWLLNIRGLDVSRLPVALSHVILHADSSVEFFVDRNRLPTGFEDHVGKGVSLYEPCQLQPQLELLSQKSVLVDPATSNAWFKLTLENCGAHVTAGADPCLLPKARKNQVEAQGMRDCHVRDGLAMVKFLHWLDTEVDNGNLHDEAILASKLESFRRLDETLVDLSFDTISAATTNAAMCHYNHENQPAPGKLSLNTLYLVDSGGQYLDGTTDITRTIAIGQPTTEMIHQFTLVLKGHIGIATARFPKGTCGYQIDALARQHLWAEGFDFDHGTGHGVGHFLSVHEGPQSISKRQINVALEQGMVLSNEPGYYRADAFGIRIENLEIVVEQKTKGDFSVLGFESLTRCPIDKRNIDLSMLTTNEINWLNDYHQLVWQDLNSQLEGDALNWLREATLPL